MEKRNDHDMKPAQKNIPIFLIACSFVIVIAGFCILFFAMPKQEISMIERRSLAPVPNFTWESLLNKSYADSLNLYFADNFPFRDTLSSLSFSFKKCRGIPSPDIAIYRSLPSLKNDKSVKAPDTDGTNLYDTTGMASSGVFDTTGFGDDKGEIIDNWIVIWHGMAMQMFGGTKSIAISYAAALNKYQEALSGKTTIYNVLIPSPTEFYLPQEYRKYTQAEKPFIDLINTNLKAGVKVVDAYSEMAAHKNEYLYFRTDHHWTGLGAYYAYVAFCKSAGFTAMPLNSLTRKAKKNFIGSLYSYTHDSKLLKNPDSVEYFIIPGNYKTWIYYASNPKKAVPGNLIVEYARGGNSYGVFLGGDFPLMKTESGIKNGRRALVVKCSYGNAFAPFLAAHYEQLFIADYRYYKQGLLNLIVENNITDLIFINSIVLANASWHVQCIKNAMYFRNTPIVIPKDSIYGAKDSANSNRPDSVKAQ